MTKYWTTVIEQDPNDPESLILEFPDDMLEQAGWLPGDKLVWVVEDDQTVIIRKQ